MPSEPRIIDRGRGPEIEGTRITVYDIMDYYRAGHHHSVIAAILNISSREVQCAIDYIENHKAEVEADYQRILDRIAKGNPPEVQKKLDLAHERFVKMVEDRRRTQAEEDRGARVAGGQ